MHFKALCELPPARRRVLRKTLLIMRLIAAILLLGCVTASATGKGQTVSLNVTNAPVKKVLKEIIRQTRVTIIYNEEDISKAKPITLDLKNAPLHEALTTIFKDQPLSFSINGNTIAIKEKTTQFSDTPPPLTQLPPPIDVKGRIVNEAGEPVVGASVIVKGTTQGTNTNADGYFELKNIDENAMLVISAVNIESREVKVNGRTNLNTIGVRMKMTTEDAVTVVSTGYWTTDKKTSTGNISKITSTEIEKQTITNPLLAIQGRMPGVSAIQRSGVPGTGVVIQIRGQNSLRNWNPNNDEPGGNWPLYVVDGVPIYPEPFFSYGRLTSISAGGIDPLRTMNPADILSIEVLKDADATAIYGSRGANGVVLVTTKKGRAGATSFDVQAYQSWGKASRMMDLMNTEQYIAMRMEAFANDNLSPAASDVDVNGTWDRNRYTDWQKVLFGGTANITNISAFVSGGNAGTTFRLGGGFYTESTIYPGDFGYTRASGSLNVNHASANQRFRASVNINYGADKNDLLDKNLVSYALTLPPNAPGYTQDGKIDWTGYTTNFDQANPFSYLLSRDEVAAKRIVAGGVLSYEIIKGIRVETNLGFTDADIEQVIKTPKSSLYPGSPTLNSNMLSVQGNHSWIVEPKFVYSGTLLKGKLDVLIGTTFQEMNSTSRGLQGQGYASDGLLGNIGAAATKIILKDNTSQYRYTSVYGRIGYNWDQKYILNLTGRRDGSSRFGPGKQFGNFGAIGAAWIFSNEKFLSNSSILSFGKLRASYGTTGNDNIQNYGYLSTYSPAGYTYQGSSILNSTALANPDFAWESNRKLEIAIDLGFLNDRINFAGSWYRNRSSNQLVGYPLPATTGFTSVQYNLNATVQNTGAEFQLVTKNVLQKNFKWSTAINLTIPRNKLISYPGIEQSSHANTYVVGEPLTISKRYQFIGINPTTGFYEVMDIDGNGSINDADRQMIFNQGRTFFGGIQNTLGMGDFELDFLTEFVKQMASNYWGLFHNQPGRMGNQLSQVLSAPRWMKAGDEPALQKFTTLNTTMYSRAASSDMNVTNASYIRLKTISLTYKLRKNMLQKLKLKDCRVYAQGQNLFTHSDYYGLNPESPFLEQPPLRTITVGALLTF